MTTIAQMLNVYLLATEGYGSEVDVPGRERKINGTIAHAGAIAIVPSEGVGSIGLLGNRENYSFAVHVDPNVDGIVADGNLLGRYFRSRFHMGAYFCKPF